MSRSRLRKETSAGVIAGAVSGVPVGFVFAAFGLLMITGILESRFRANPILATNAHTILLFLEVFMVVVYVALTSFFGAIAGFIFVKAINKLPFRSTYIKAVVPWAVLLVLYTVLELLLDRPSLNGVIRSVTWELPPSALLFAGAILFAYLFNRWANHQQPPQVSIQESK